MDSDDRGLSPETLLVGTRIGRSFATEAEDPQNNKPHIGPISTKARNNTIHRDRDRPTTRGLPSLSAYTWPGRNATRPFPPLSAATPKGPRSYKGPIKALAGHGGTCCVAAPDPRSGGGGDRDLQGRGGGLAHLSRRQCPNQGRQGASEVSEHGLPELIVCAHARERYKARAFSWRVTAEARDGNSVKQAWAPYAALRRPLPGSPHPSKDATAGATDGCLRRGPTPETQVRRRTRS